MTKQEILQVFAESGGFFAPDDARKRLGVTLDRRSFYSYLLRLSRQGLLERRHKVSNGRIIYRITPRGMARLQYFRRLR